MIKNQEIAETAIREARKTIDYNTVEYPQNFCKSDRNLNLEKG
jgi:hypothetical protein